MILSCIDGGLICGPVAIILYLCGVLGIGAWLKRKFKWCRKECKCDCHGVDKQ